MRRNCCSAVLLSRRRTIIDLIQSNNTKFINLAQPTHLFTMPRKKPRFHSLKKLVSVCHDADAGPVETAC